MDTCKNPILCFKLAYLLGVLKIWNGALAGWFSWLECCPLTPRGCGLISLRAPTQVAGLVPGQHMREATNWCFPFFPLKSIKTYPWVRILKKNWNGEENESYISMNETWNKTSLIGEGLLIEWEIRNWGGGYGDSICSLCTISSSMVRSSGQAVNLIFG